MSHVRVERADGIVLAALAGEVDLTREAAIREAVLAELDDAEALIVDLTEVTFFDSSGVRVLDHLLGRCEQRGIGFRAVAPPDAAARLVLRLTVFREDLVAESVDEAAAALQRRP